MTKNKSDITYGCFLRLSALKKNLTLNFMIFLFFSDSVLSMDIPSTGPTSLRSEIGDDMGPIEEAEEAFLKN